MNYIKYLIVVFLTFCVLSNPLQESKSWAQNDLDQMYVLIIDNHPGIYNSEDPDFVKKVNEYYDVTLQKLKRARSDQERITILESFARSFNDTHLAVKYFCNHSAPNQIPSKFYGQPSIKTFSGSIYWIRIPTFEITGENVDLFLKIIEQMPSLQTAGAIIFDVRGNRGGNSAWGSKLIKELFGEKYYIYYSYLATANEYVEWRASTGNLEYLKGLHAQLHNEFGKHSQEADSINTIVQGMQKALNANENYYKEFSEPISLDKPIDDQVKAQIMVIIDNKCGSACLDFIDELKALNHRIKLIGQTTNADSCYMEVRKVLLPSEKGEFYFPIKVYHNRPRGHNQPYHPDIFYDNFYDEHTLEEFVINQSICKGD